MKQPTILSFGEVLWDLFPDGERFGGAPANFACHAALGGANVKIVSAIGDDQHGREAGRILRSAGVDISLLQVHPTLATGTVGVVVDAEGLPTYEIHDSTAWDAIQWTDLLAAVTPDVDLIYFGTLGQRSSPSRETIRRSVSAGRDFGIPRLLDVNLRVPFFNDDAIREAIDLASVLKLSDEELPMVAAAYDVPSDDRLTTLRELLDQTSLDMIVMTCGPDGAILVSQTQTLKQPGIPVEVRDTVGAGDAFTARLAMGLFSGEELQTMLKRACEYAADICSISGAIPTQ